MTYFDKNFPLPLKQMVFDYVQSNRQTPTITLAQLRKQNYEISTEPYSLNNFYQIFSSVSDKSSYMSESWAVFISEMFSDIITYKEITEVRLFTIRDACYAIFEDCLNEYEAKHPRKSTRNLKAFLSSVPTSILWVMQCWDQQALTHFSKRLMNVYDAPFQKALQQELLNRGISILPKTITDNTNHLEPKEMIELVNVLHKEISKLQELPPDPRGNLLTKTDSVQDTGGNDFSGGDKETGVIKIIKSRHVQKILSGNHGTLDGKGNET